MTSWAKIIESSDIILSSIFREDSAFLMFHDDADGCCSAAIFQKLISDCSKRSLIGFGAPERHSVELTDGLTRKIKEKNPRFIISLDLPLRDSVTDLRKLLDYLKAEMLIYDHHVISKPFEWPPQCIYVDPRNFGLGDIPASYYSFRLYEHYSGKQDLCWIAAVGVVADYRTDTCRDLIEEVKRHYPKLYPYKEINQSTALLSPLVTIGDTLNAGYQHSPDSSGAIIAVKALNEAINEGDPSTVLEGRTKHSAILCRFKERIDREMDEYLYQIESRAEFLINSMLMFYHIKPKYEIVSRLSSKLQHLYSKTIIIVLAPLNSNLLKVSLRRGKEVRIDLAELAHETTKNLESASGGGHPDAAGCVIDAKDADPWKQNVIDYVRDALIWQNQRNLSD